MVHTSKGGPEMHGAYSGPTSALRLWRRGRCLGLRGDGRTGPTPATSRQRNSVVMALAIAAYFVTPRCRKAFGCAYIQNCNSEGVLIFRVQHFSLPRSPLDKSSFAEEGIVGAVTAAPSRFGTQVCWTVVGRSVPPRTEPTHWCWFSSSACLGQPLAASTNCLGL